MTAEAWADASVVLDAVPWSGHADPSAVRRIDGGLWNSSDAGRTIEIETVHPRRDLEIHFEVAVCCGYYDDDFDVETRPDRLVMAVHEWVLVASRISTPPGGIMQSRRRRRTFVVAF